MKRSIYMSILLCCMMFLIFTFNNYQKINAKQNIEINATSYEFNNSSKYVLDDDNIVNEMTFGKKQLGKLTISGNITQESTFRNTVAYGIKENISFSYSYDGSLQTSNKKEWNLVSDSGKSVNEVSLTGSIAKGVLLIQKSYEGDVWTTVGNPVVNFYETNKTGAENFYTTAGEDVAQGVYYRIIFAYKTGKKTGTSGILWWEEDVYDYKKHAEVYKFYVALDTATLSLHNLSITEGGFESDEYSVELLKRGETLQDGDTTTAGFSIDKLGSSFYVSASKNNEEKIELADGSEITENGKYLIESVTKLGTSKTYTIYVFNGGEDKGYSTYFNESIIDGKRIFRYNDYPTYAKNASLKIKAISEFVPVLQGSIKNLTTNEVVEIEKTREQQSYALTAGEYEAVFYTGNIESGSFYEYTFKFIVTDEEAKPFVNKDNLSKTYRVMDYTPKHYEVAYQTTLGGYIFVCFSLDSYEAAYNYAYEIEKRFIESTDDGLYYKSIDNPNLKVKYFDYLDMVSVINYYAKQNVEINYFNVLDEFTYRTYDNDLLENLEFLSIKESIKVFPNTEEQEKILNRQMFINDFEFVSVADYDSVKVEAYCYKNGITYVLEYNKDVSQQLTISSKYKIIETNKYGDVLEYDVYYIFENQTTSRWELSNNGTSSIFDVSSNILTENKIEVTADSIILKNIQNLLDPLSIVTIKAPEVYSFEIKCYISELSNIALYKKGKYELTFIDRVGTSYKFIINISGSTRYSDLFNENTDNVSFSVLHNNIYLNKVTLDEEIIFNVEDLKNAIDRVVNKDLYTNTSYQIYKTFLDAAIEIYQNQSAIQKDINEATKNLNDAYDGLVLTTNKTELHAKLDLFEATSASLYTQISFIQYQKAYNEAKQVYLMDDPSETEVSEAVKALDDAYKNLVKKGDRDVLKPKLDEAKAIDCSKYTPASIEILNNVYEEAYSLYLNEDASQSAIEEALTKLTNAINDLVNVANFTQLHSALLQAQQITLVTYTKNTAEAFKLVYDAALVVYKDFNNTQDKVDLAKTNLLTAISNLVLAGNTTELKNKMNTIKEIKDVLYTKETIRPLKEKYQEAITAIEQREQQSKLNEINAELSTLIDSLVKRENKQVLLDKLSHAHSIDLSKYSKSKVKSFENTYQEALTVLNSIEASDEEINTAIKNLEKAEKNLNENEDSDFSLIDIVILVITSLVILWTLIKKIRK